jgi:hypothetical protein
MLFIIGTSARGLNPAFFAGNESAAADSDFSAILAQSREGICTPVTFFIVWCIVYKDEREPSLTFTGVLYTAIIKDI